MTSDENRRRARGRVSDEMARQDLGTYELARRAGVDPATLADFLNGKRWPQVGSRTKISVALGLAPEAIDTLARGDELPDTETVGPVDDAPRVLLDIDPEVYDAMDPISQRRAKAEAEAAFYRIAQEARRRADADAEDR